jgi:hypothetical protein
MEAMAKRCVAVMDLSNAAIQQSNANAAIQQSNTNATTQQSNAI